MFKRFALAVAITLSFSLPVFAERGQQGDFEVGPYVGYAFFSDYGSHNIEQNLLYGVRLGYFFEENWSFEPSYQMLWTDTDRATGTNNGASLRALRFNLLYNFLPGKRLRPFLTGGLGWEYTKVNGSFKSNDLGVNAGGGLRVFLTDYLAARLDGRFVYTEVSELDARQYNYEAMFGLTYLFGGKPPADTDGDGIPDKKDACAETPKGATVNPEGCPSDSDGDGVFDGIDQCARTIKGLKVNEKGCTMDSDGDAVPDGADQCEGTPAGMPVDGKGCPKDKDTDGVSDDKDQCPDTPAGTPVDEKGCPLDTDKDGVPDHLDQCPNTEAGKDIDAMGCPKVSLARGVLQGVNFKTGSADLTLNSQTILDGVAEELNKFPKVRVEVQGHTDSSGSEQINLKVSDQRANSVVDYLVSKGVDRGRLDARGYGEAEPIADNNTREGRRKNRRVELKWLD